MYIISDCGGEIWRGDASSPEDALLKAVEAVGDWEVAIYDDQKNHPEWRLFNSVHDALKVFVPEAIADIRETTN